MSTSVLTRYRSDKRRLATYPAISARRRNLLGAGAVVVVLALWETGTRTGFLNPLVTSSPSSIGRAFVTLSEDGILGPAVLESAKLFIIGFGLSLVTGIIGGTLLGWYKPAGAVMDPFVSILYAAPRVALIPIINVWVGIGFTAQIVILWLIAVFPIMINVSAGIGTLDRQLFQVARSFLGTNRDVLRTLAIPATVPYLMSGIRQGLAQALTGVVVAEYFIGGNGVGGLIINAGMTLQTANAFVGLVIFAGSAIVLTAILRRLERRFDKWRP